MMARRRVKPPPPRSQVVFTLGLHRDGGRGRRSRKVLLLEDQAWHSVDRYAVMEVDIDRPADRALALFLKHMDKLPPAAEQA